MNYQTDQAADQLSAVMECIDQVFCIDTILRNHIDYEYVSEYYKQSDIGYRIVHSDKGAVHMALNFNGRFDREGYLEQARIVDRLVDAIDARSVLELAAGKGFNSAHLARAKPHVEFSGIDLTHRFVKAAQSRARCTDNLTFLQGNFEKLPFRDNMFDLVFEVEGICHAANMHSVLSETRRVLNTGGRFVVFDGFRLPGFSQATANQKLAARLVEASMAIKEGWLLSDWIHAAEANGFRIEQVRDFSSAIMPNLLRFQRIARKFFDGRLLRKVLKWYFPPLLVMNSIAGLLMPHTISANVQGYFMIELSAIGATDETSDTKSVTE